MRRFCAIVALFALAGVVLLAGPSTGAAKSSKRADSNLSVGIGFGSGTGYPFFQGSVKSGKKGCVASRRITIVFERNRGKTKFFGRAKSDSNGSWRVGLKLGMRLGGYFARVKKTKNCRYDATNPVPVSHNSPLGYRALRALRSFR